MAWLRSVALWTVGLGLASGCTRDNAAFGVDDGVADDDDGGTTEGRSDSGATSTTTTDPSATSTSTSTSGPPSDTDPVEACNNDVFPGVVLPPDVEGLPLFEISRSDQGALSVYPQNDCRTNPAGGVEVADFLPKLEELGGPDCYRVNVTYALDGTAEHIWIQPEDLPVTAYMLVASHDPNVPALAPGNAFTVSTSLVDECCPAGPCEICEDTADLPGDYALSFLSGMTQLDLEAGQESERDFGSAGLWLVRVEHARARFKPQQGFCEGAFFWYAVARG